MKKLLIILMMFLFIPISNAQETLDDEQWREDIDTLIAQLLDRHPDPFFRFTDSDFEQAAADLKADLPDLTYNQIILRLIQICAMFDGHTILFPLQEAIGFRLYPVWLYEFEEGFYVVKAEDPELVGMKLVKIGETDADTVYETLVPYTTHDNEYQLKRWIPLMMVTAEVLEAAGLVSDLNAPNFVLENADGEQVTVNFEPQTLTEYQAWSQEGPSLTGLPTQPDLLYLSNKGENFWFTLLDDTLYIQYNGVQSRSQSGLTMTFFLRDIETALAENEIEKVVVDVRHNTGGEMSAFPPFVRALQESDAINDKLYVITGRQTFSAAVHFSVALADDAIFVGEPAGGTPLYGNARVITLPNSGIDVLVTTTDTPQDMTVEEDLWVVPDIPVVPTADDYFKGRDAALEAILNGD